MTIRNIFHSSPKKEPELVIIEKKVLAKRSFRFEFLQVLLVLIVVLGVTWGITRAQDVPATEPVSEPAPEEQVAEPTPEPEPAPLEEEIPANTESPIDISEPETPIELETATESETATETPATDTPDQATSTDTNTGGIFENIIDTISDIGTNITDTLLNLFNSTSAPSEEGTSIASSTAPILFGEQETETGKLVTVSSPEEDPNNPHTNVLASTTIPEIYSVGEEDKIQIKWTNNGDQEMSFQAYDTDNNGKLDYVEWTIPHLSTQIFEIIFISKAFHLDTDQTIVADIYDTVKTQDGNFASLTDGQYVRATFEQILNNTKDITVYAKAANNNTPASIEVFPLYEDELGNLIEGPSIATFPDITEAGTYKVLLTNLETPTDRFDLKVSGDIEVDLVIDPIYTIFSCGVTLSIPSVTYYIVADLSTASGNCITINASDVIIDGLYETVQYSITNTGSDNGIKVNSGMTGVTIQNLNISNSAGTGIYNEGSISNLYATVTNSDNALFGIDNYGTIVDISGTTTNSTSFVGIVNNSGSAITNISGTIINSGAGYGVTNSGTISNISGSVTNSNSGYGVSNGGTISDISGIIDNSGIGYGISNNLSSNITINSIPTLTNTGGGISFQNFGNVNGSGTITEGITLESGSSLDLSGGLTVQRTLINNGGTITPVDDPSTYSCSGNGKVLGNIFDGANLYGMCEIPLTTTVDRCGIITSAGTYTLNTNLSVSTGDCITIATNDVTLDGGGYTIENSGTTNWTNGAIRISNSTGIIIQNINITNSGSGSGIYNYAGTITDITDSVTVTNSAGGYGIFNDGGTITDISGSVTNSGAGYSIASNSIITDISGTVTNSGTGTGINTEGTGVITITSAPTLINSGGGTLFDNYGTVNGSGTIIGDFTNQSSGTFDLSGGLTFQGNITNNGGTIIPQTTINSWTELNLMRYNLAGSYTLANDLTTSDPDYATIGGNWTPIGDCGGDVCNGGNTDNPFTGTFDGGGFTIQGLTSTSGGKAGVGLFAYMNGATISNIVVSDVNFSEYQTVGGLVGYQNGGSITNASSTGSVYSSNGDVGGLVGYQSYGTITNSYSAVSVSATASNTGGLVGYQYYSSITNSYATGSVTGGGSGYYVGGLVGYQYYSSITNSYATGAVSGYYYVGGLVGAQEYYNTISDSYSIGSAYGASSIGGLVGRQYYYSTITNSYSAGSVQSYWWSNYGGLVGYQEQYSSISNSFWDKEASSVSYMCSLDWTGTGCNDTKGKTTAEMKGLYTLNSFLGTNWDIVGGQADNNNGYPYLSMGGSNVWYIPSEATNPFAGGDGSQGNPYQITTWTQLNYMRYNLSAYYILNNSLASSDGDYWGIGDNWTPIGDCGGDYCNGGNTDNPFTGNFDGGGYTIQGLYSYLSSNYGVGLFGLTSAATISNIGLTDVNITGYYYVGGLVGYQNNYTSISNSYSTGTVIGANSGSYIGGLVGAQDYYSTITNSYSTVTNVNGYSYVGGLVGYQNYGSITNSYSTGTVTGNYGSYYNGGLVGYQSSSSITGSYSNATVSDGGNNYYNGGLVGYQIYSTIIGSYSTGPVSGTYYVGGLVGKQENYNTISDSYSIGSVSGGSYVGGLVGNQYYYSTITNSYAAGSVSSYWWQYYGGLVGYQEYYSTITNSFWDTQTSGQSGMCGSTDGTGTGCNTAGRTSADMKKLYLFSSFSGVNWDISGGQTDLNNGYPYLSLTGSSPVWLIPDNTTTPFANGDGSPGNPYQITTWTELNSIRYSLGSSYKLMNDLNTGGDYSGIGDNWTPIGDCAQSYCWNNYGTPFSGTFDGDGKTIDSLTMYGSNYGVGLFGYSNGTISNLGVTNVSIDIGYGYFVGGLVGFQNGGSLSNSYTTGNITDSNPWSSTEYIGGLAGYGNGISNSYSSVNITSNENNVGGLVGEGNNISNSYSTGSVSGGYSVGGLAGYGSYISNSYATGNVSGNSSVGGFAGYSYEISNSYSTGGVSGSSYVGGFVGYQSSSITNSYSTGGVSGSSYVGGFVGYQGGAYIYNSFWNSETSGNVIMCGYANGSGCDDSKGLTISQMQSFLPFLSGGWSIGSGTDVNYNGYPYLAWQASNNSYTWLTPATSLNFWLNTSGDNNWDNTLNWFSGVVPADGENVYTAVTLNLSKDVTNNIYTLADNLYIYGNGHIINGSITAQGSPNGYTIYINDVIVTGSVVADGISNNANNAGYGGTINIASSTIQGTTTSTGGNSFNTGFGNYSPGYGGTINITNSTSTSIVSNGGDGSYPGTGGSISIVNSSFTNIESIGGDYDVASGFSYYGSNGGSVSIVGNNINLEGSTINLSGGLGDIANGYTYGSNGNLYFTYQGVTTNTSTYLNNIGYLQINNVSYIDADPANSQTCTNGIVVGSGCAWNGLFNPLISYYNNATGDGDWNNILNWWNDFEYTDQAEILPSPLGQVFINGAITQNTGNPAVAYTLALNATSTNSISISVTQDTIFNGESANSGIITTTGSATFNGGSSNTGTITAATSTFYEDLTSTVGGTIVGFIQRIFTSSATSTRNFTTEGGRSNWTIISTGVNTIVNLANATYDLATNIFKGLLGGSFVENESTVTPPFNSQWSGVGLSRSWRAIASSADGTKLVAAEVNYGRIYRSTDSGANWTEVTSASPTNMQTYRSWTSIASSADGTKLVATVSGGRIYTSTNSGIDWTEVTSASPANMATNRGWTSVTSSADGTKLVAVVYGGRVYRSINSGVDWTEVTSASPANMATNRNWYSITSDSTGQYLAAVINGGRVYRSINSGVDWTEVTSASPANMATNRNWYSITSSADGTKLAAVDFNYGKIYTSTNSGIDWTARETNGYWRGIASSADGTKLVAVDYYGYRYISTNSGVSWVATGNYGNWYSVTSSADGTKLAAIDVGYSQISISTPEEGTGLDVVPDVTINSPVSTSTSDVIKWLPSIDWGTARLCQYSYNNYSSLSTLNCALGGADLPRPTAGEHTLYIRATDNHGGITEKSVTYNYDNTVPTYTMCGTDLLDEATRPYYYLTANTSNICTASVPVTLWGNASSTIPGYTLSGNYVSGGNAITFNNITTSGETTGAPTYTNNGVNSGTVVGNTIFDSTSYNSGTVLGTARFNAYTASSGVVTISNNADFKGTGRVGGLIKDSLGNTITSWILNSGTILTGVLIGQTTFNGDSSNVGTVMSSATTTFNGDLASSTGDVLSAYINNYTGVFLPLSQTNRQWYGITSTPNGDVYATAYSGDIYKQTGGTGNFIALGQTSRSWIGITSTPNGNVYAAANNGDIYKQTGGTGNFIALGQTSRSWYGMTSASNGDVYAVVYNGDIYKQTGGTGNFVALGQTSRSWVGITAAPNGDMYAGVNGGDIYKQTGGTGNFIALGQTSRSWFGMTSDSNGDVYAVVQNGDIYKQTGGTGNFVALGQTSRSWTTITSTPNGDMYAGVIGGDIYKLIPSIVQPQSTSTPITRIFTSAASTTRNFLTEAGHNNWIIVAQGVAIDISNAIYNTTTNIFKAILGVSNTIGSFFWDGNAGGQVVPQISIATTTIPYTGSALTKTLKWNPHVNWDTATTCIYSYSSDFSSPISSPCGSDDTSLARPTGADANTSRTVYLRGTDIRGDISETKLTYFYDNTSPVWTSCGSDLLDETSRPYYYLASNTSANCTATVSTILRGAQATSSSAFTLTGNVLAGSNNLSLSNIAITGVASSTGSVTIASSTIASTIDVASTWTIDALSTIGSAVIRSSGTVQGGNFTGNVTNNGTLLTTSAPILVSGNTTNNGTITGDFVFNSASINAGTVSGTSTMNGTSANTGTTTNLILNTLTATSGEITFSGSTNFLGTGFVTDSIKDSLDAPISRWIFTDSSTNSGRTTGTALFYDTSANTSTISGDAHFSDSSTNSGTVTGDADIYYPHTMPMSGTVTGTKTYHSYPNTISFSPSGDNLAWSLASNWYTDATLSTPLGRAPVTSEDVVLFASTTLATSTTNNVYIGTNNITLDGAGKTLTGFVSGNGAYGSLNAYDFNLSEIIVTGIVTANGASDTNGGNGGLITIATSTTDALYANGGNGTTNGGNGGNITITNSIGTNASSTPIYANGGNSTSCGNGGDAGEVTLLASTYGTISTNGGSAAVSGCPSESKTSGTTRNPVVQGTYTPPSSGSTGNTGANTGASTEGASSGGSSSAGMLRNLIKKVLSPIIFTPLQNFTPFAPNFNPATIGTTVIPNPFQNFQAPGLVDFTSLPFNFITNISRFLFSPATNSITQLLKSSPGLASYLASLGISNEQEIANLATTPIRLTQPLSDDTTPPGLFIIKSGQQTLSSYATYDKELGLIQLVKVAPNQSLSISVIPTSLLEVSGTYLNQALSFIQSLPYTTTYIQTPTQAGRYTLNTNASPLPLVIEVIQPVAPTPAPKPWGIFNFVWKLFNR